MNYSTQLASRFREVMLEGKWVANTNFKDQLSDVDLKEAYSKVGDLNTIAALTFHVNYYIEGVLNVFKGGDLEIRDKYSFDLPTMASEKDWDQLKTQLWKNAEEFAVQVEQIPREQLDEVFVDERYGNFLRNIEGMIEHCYYHLGQITLIRKLL